MKTDLPHPTIPRRSGLLRRSALVWAVVFAVFGIRSAYADAGCAHHTGHLGHQAAEHGHGSAHHDHAAAGGAGDSQHDEAADAGGDPNDETDAGPCLCIEACQLAGVQGLPAWVHEPHSPQASEYLGVVAATSARGNSARDRYLLPFATAPPLDC